MLMKNGNMTDITNKCPVDLCQIMHKVLGDNMFDESLVNKEVEDIYDYIIEKNLSNARVDLEQKAYNLTGKPREKIAFNKFFLQNDKMKTFKEIQDNYRVIDFFLSMSCNKNCHYCTSYTLEMRNLTVDRFFKKSISLFKKYKVRINLLGGEPGLIKNLDEVINEIKKMITLLFSII